jgi:heme exporter protein B
MRILATLIARDLRLAYGGGNVTLPVVFFLLVATLYPFGVGPDGALLARTGGGVLWIGALLASILPIDRLIAHDLDQGFLDQLAVREVGEEIVGVAKLVAHWLSFGPPLMLAAIPAAALLRLEGATLLRLEIGLLLGTPGLAALAVIIAAITASLRGAAALGGLLMLPLAIPILIFGAGSLDAFGSGGLKLLAACSMLAVAAAPFAVGAAIRAARE